MRRFCAPFLILLVAGCAAPGLQSPSLAPRSAEGIDPRVPVAEPQLSAVVDAALAARLEALVGQARTGDAQFQVAAGAAQRAAVAAGGPQSESWVVAQQALSALVAAREPVPRALADIDALGAGRIQQLGGIAAADLAAIQAAAARVAEIDRRQSEIIDQLQARLR